MQDEARVQKVTERLHTLEEVDNSVKLLGEMLRHYSREGSAEADKELMKVGPGEGVSAPRRCCAPGGPSPPAARPRAVVPPSAREPWLIHSTHPPSA